MKNDTGADMETYLYKLNFQGSTHFGDTGIDLENVCERVSSDTLFSAFVNTIRTIYGIGAATDFINEFIPNPPFLLSSLFVYSEEKFFLPRPLIDKDISTEIKMKMGKELKSLAWITPENFLKWLKANVGDSDLGRMLEEQELYKKAYSIEIRPRVTLDRVKHNSNIYHCGYVYFKENAGLYGLVTFDKREKIEFFKGILENLGNIGLGGEKTYGSGMFKIISFDKVGSHFEQILNTKSPFSVLLSLYHPANEEIPMLHKKVIAYDITRSKGWISTGRYALPLKRKSVGFFTEGSIINGNPRGCLVDVTPDSDPYKILQHKVFRYGYAFTTPLGGGNAQ